MPNFPSYGGGNKSIVDDVNLPSREAASLLLVESLIHGLIARSILTVREAIEIIDIAAEVERELHATRVVSENAFVSFLDPLSRSLQLDLND